MLERTITPERTLEVMRAFAKDVVRRATANAKRNANATGSLSGSIESDLTVSKNSFRLEFTSNDYGAFLDEGVKGANPNLVNKGKQKAPNSQFKFKKKKPPVEPLIKWAKLKNIRLRDEKGKYKKGNYRSIGFILQRRIFAQGIKPTLFFTTPYNKFFENLPEDVAKAYGLDSKDFILNKKLK